jgi:hypothetical protein
VERTRRNMEGSDGGLRWRVPDGGFKFRRVGLDSPSLEEMLAAHCSSPLPSSVILGFIMRIPWGHHSLSVFLYKKAIINQYHFAIVSALSLESTPTAGVCAPPRRRSKRLVQILVRRLPSKSTLCNYYHYFFLNFATSVRICGLRGSELFCEYCSSLMAGVLLTALEICGSARIWRLVEGAQYFFY